MDKNLYRTTCSSWLGLRAPEEEVERTGGFCHKSIQRLRNGRPTDVEWLNLTGLVIELEREKLRPYILQNTG